MLHPDIFGEITEKIVPGKHVIDIIDQSLKGNFGNDMLAQQQEGSMKKVNESAQEDILPGCTSVPTISRGSRT